MFLPLRDTNKLVHVDVPFVNYALLGITVLVFLIQFAGGSGLADRIHIEFGMIPVVVRDLYESPAPWLPDQTGLVTYMFLHADWLHLLSNMLFLWVFGDNIEDALGHVRYLLFYLACGIFAGLAHLWFYPDSTSPLIGASGAVAGVIGAYILLYPHVRVWVLSRIVIPLPLAIPAWGVLGLWIATQVFTVLMGGDQGVAWWAHIGGVLAGGVLIVLFKRRDVRLFGSGA